MKALSLILTALIILICTLPIFSSAPIISGNAPEDPIHSATFGSDYFVLIIALLCISAVALIVLLIVSAIMKRKK